MRLRVRVQRHMRCWAVLAVACVCSAAAENVASFGDCLFHKGSDGVLSRTGACPNRSGIVYLGRDSIKSLTAGVFDGMAQVT